MEERAHEPSRVLVVEDDRDLRDLMTLALEGDGYRVERARDGREALEIVDERMPDLILLDMRMPAMNGWEFARNFHERYDHQRPIVVVTAAANAGQRAEEIGADGYVAKPFDLEELLGEVHRHT